MERNGLEFDPGKHRGMVERLGVFASRKRKEIAVLRVVLERQSLPSTKYGDGLLDTVSEAGPRFLQYFI